MIIVCPTNNYSNTVAQWNAYWIAEYNKNEIILLIENNIGYIGIHEQVPALIYLPPFGNVTAS